MPKSVLDPDQQAAAEAPDGPLLVVAGPGTGKTRTLTHRIAHLVSERGVDPGQCLAVTFSRRAAAEMEERLSALVPGTVGRTLVTTFHGLGLALLQEHAEEAGLAPGFRIATPAERMEVVRHLFGVSSTRGERALEEIGQYRRGSGRARKAVRDSKLERSRERAASYEQELVRRNLLDFDDLLLRPLFLLRARPDLVAHCRERFRRVFIDEYQDIDPLQYELVRLLCPPDGDLCAIGDPDQSIYRFRDADVGFFLRFREDWPAARVVHLTRNYRSTRTVVEAACQAIRPASLVPDRRLVAVRPDGGADERIVVASAASEKAEAELVVHTLERLLGGTSSFSFDSGRVGYGDTPSLSFADVAILYRTEAQTPPLVEALARAGIPFQKRSHRPLLEQPGVSRVLQALRDQASPGSVPGSVEAALDRAMPIGERAAAELLRPLATRSGDDLEGFLADVELGAEVDTWDPRAEGVSLLTLHASKGLEFPVVFLVGCEDGLLPLVWPGRTVAEDLAEERRLFFVGLTRARSRLFLFHSRRRTVRGETVTVQPSPFLADLQAGLLERREEILRPRRPEQLKLV